MLILVSLHEFLAGGLEAGPPVFFCIVFMVHFFMFMISQLHAVSFSGFSAEIDQTRGFAGHAAPRRGPRVLGASERSDRGGTRRGTVRGQRPVWFNWEVEVAHEVAHGMFESNRFGR